MPRVCCSRRAVGRRGDRLAVNTEEEEEYKNDIYMRMWNDVMRSSREFESDEESPPSSELIEVDSVDFYVIDNAKSHHTEKYDLLKDKKPPAVFRRGEPFKMSIKFNRPFNIEKDKVKIKLTFGNKPEFTKGAMVILHIPSEKNFKKDISWWDIAMSRNENTMLTLQIQIPYSAFVGYWYMKIESGDKNPKVFEHKERIYILFNPWNKEDPVYMEDEKLREEYVLNDRGKVFMGTYDNRRSSPWEFGQFDAIALLTSVRILNNSGLDSSVRGNPVHVVRALSAMINKEDERGVLHGNWSGEYEDGTNPMSWKGSLTILKKYYHSRAPVKYGQCWVFSGVLTTVCRALGIPCRSVTNYRSCHDKKRDLTLDIYVNEDGDRDNKRSEDSIWNFHVWNDCWMTRYDLPRGYGGWQAVDATPQETSDGIYRSGPTSLVAIRRGEIHHIYDTLYVFAEVNADIVTWQISKDCSAEKDDCKIINVNTNRVGKLIATKTPGFYDEKNELKDLEDITRFYKAKEGSAMERISVMIAARRLGREHIYDMEKRSKADVEFNLKEMEKVTIGKDFHVVAEVENLSDEERTVTSAIAVSTVYYTGVIGKKVKKTRGTFTLKPKEKQEFGIHVTNEDYFEKLVDQYMIKIFVAATVKETKQPWVDEYDMQLQTPNLKIEIEGEVKLNKRFDIKFSFTNPLKLTLDNCELGIEGSSGLMKSRSVELPDVGPEETMTHVEHCTPTRTGGSLIVAVFTSRQLMDIRGSKIVKIEE